MPERVLVFEVVLTSPSEMPSVGSDLVTVEVHCLLEVLLEDLR